LRKPDDYVIASVLFGSDRSRVDVLTPGRNLLLAVLLTFAAAGSAGAAEINIAALGVRVSGGVTSVRLVNNTSGVAAWMTVGQTFGGYVISGFDERNNAVVLVRDSVRVLLPLKTPRVQSSRGGNQPAPAADTAAVSSPLTPQGAEAAPAPAPSPAAPEPAAAPAPAPSSAPQRQ